MSRKRKDRLSEENHERWLVSYADFITLLFAFFVVMYSISSVNEGKYKVLSSTLGEAFGRQASSEQGSALSNLQMPRGELLMPGEQTEMNGFARQFDERAELARQMAAAQQRLSDELQISLQQYLDNGDIDLSQNGDRIEIAMKAGILFGSGDSRLSETALDVLRVVAKSLLSIRNQVQVEGHTDNVPITSEQFPSNWELSAGRAATVVHFLSAQGIAPQRLAAVGLGEHRPLRSNDDEAGRAANRRVTLVILGAAPEALDPDEVVPWSEGPAVRS